MDIVKLTRDNSYQRIKAWYINEDSVTLTDRDIELKDRLMHIWSLRINNKYSQNQIIQIIVREYKISHSTAYRSFPLAMELFGDVDKVNLAAERMILAENFWNLYQMALKKGNEDGAIKALREYKSLYNFHDTTQKVDPKKLEASVYKMVLAKPVDKMLSNMRKSGVMDFMSIGAKDVVWKAVEDKDSNQEEEDNDEELE